MERLFYFSTSDLMVRVMYNDQMNSLRYSSHRKMDTTEKLTVEHYILTQVGPDTDYCTRSPSLLVYIGIEPNLSKEYRFYQLKNTVEKVLAEKVEIDVKVKELIDSSLSSYYFEQIGDKLLLLRKEIQAGSKAQIYGIISNIEELVEAYNTHSGRQITVDEVIPQELRLCLHA